MCMVSAYVFYFIKNIVHQVESIETFNQKKTLYVYMRSVCVTKAKPTSQNIDEHLSSTTVQNKTGLVSFCLVGQRLYLSYAYLNRKIFCCFWFSVLFLLFSVFNWKGNYSCVSKILIYQKKKNFWKIFKIQYEKKKKHLSYCKGTTVCVFLSLQINQLWSILDFFMIKRDHD